MQLVNMKHCLTFQLCFIFFSNLHLIMKTIFVCLISYFQVTNTGFTIDTGKTAVTVNAVYVTSTKVICPTNITDVHYEVTMSNNAGINVSSPIYYLSYNSDCNICDPTIPSCISKVSFLKSCQISFIMSRNQPHQPYVDDGIKKHICSY